MESYITVHHHATFEYEDRKSVFIGEAMPVTTEDEAIAFIESVKKKFPDAINSYTPEWLNKSEIDIYIPSLNVGIEYQGIQHYESIDFFGGEEAFAYRQKLDARKKELCKVNGLRLVAWPYTEAITETNLKKHLDGIERK